MELTLRADEVPAHLLEFFEPEKSWLKPLDWVDVPGLFARAMQQAGWLWRSDVVWVKPSALPESVSGTRWERCRIRSGRVAVADYERRGTQVPASWDVGEHGHDRTPGGRYATATQTMQEWADCPGCPKCAAHGGLVLRRGNGRPTKATERVLLFAKRPGYFFDQEAVRERSADERMGNPGNSRNGYADGAGRNDGQTKGREWLKGELLGGRNLRDWWVLSPEPLTDAHYAAFPTSLPERCLKAGTSEWGCCPACGAPWARVVDARPNPSLGTNTGLDMTGGAAKTGNAQTSAGLHRNPGGVYAETTTLGWRPTCRCQPEQPPAPCRVLDPFGGSGSTGLAANRLGRDATLCELKPAYADLARKRLSREPLSLFAWQEASG